MAELTERWLPVVGYEDFYRISDQGRIWSNWTGGRFLKPAPASGNSKMRYLGVTLCLGDGSRKTRLLHELVLEAFVGARPAGQVGRHGPGGHLDNRLVNLCWGTYVENEEDKLRDGTRSRGETQHLAKLTDAAIQDILARGTNGPRGIRSQLAREYGVHKGTIGRVLNGKTWRHVK